MFQSSFFRASVALGVLAVGLSGVAHAEVGECLKDRQYRLCYGVCPSDMTQQGECTPRRETVGGVTTEWCCCENSFNPFSETTGSPSNSDQECSEISVSDESGTGEPGSGPDDGGKPDPNPWAASAAVKQTADPVLTDQVLYQVRDNVLSENQRTLRYVNVVYDHADEIETILKNNPQMTNQIAMLIDVTISTLVELSRGEKVTINREAARTADQLLERFAEDQGASAELKKAATMARADLRDQRFMDSLGITIGE